jgi:hypothetical protein
MAREYEREREGRDFRRRRYDRYERDERDLADRVADEVRSWFGDEDAAHRRRRDVSERERGRAGYARPRRDWGAREYDRYEGGRFPGYFRGTDPERDWDRYEYGERPYVPAYGMGGAGWAGGPWGGFYGYGGPLIPGGRYGGWGEHRDWYEGQHFGRGPREYQRSAERIREDAFEALTWHGDVDATDIAVKVEGDEITLEGTVSSRREKRMAEDAVERVRGVRDVHNRLRIQRPPEQEQPAG